MQLELSIARLIRVGTYTSVALLSVGVVLPGFECVAVEAVNEDHVGLPRPSSGADGMQFAHRVR